MAGTTERATAVRGRCVGPAGEGLRALVLGASAEAPRLPGRPPGPRPADDDDAVAPDVHPPDVDHAVFGPGLAADQLVRLRDPDDFLDAGVILEDLRVGSSLHAGDADGRAMRARDRMGCEPHLLDVSYDRIDLLVPASALHHGHPQLP